MYECILTGSAKGKMEVCRGFDEWVLISAPGKIKKTGG